MLGLWPSFGSSNILPGRPGDYDNCYSQSGQQRYCFHHHFTSLLLHPHEAKSDGSRDVWFCITQSGRLALAEAAGCDQMMRPDSAQNLRPAELAGC